MLVGLTLRPSPGIGKTRLAAACADRLAADGFRAAWVSCPEDAGAPPFWVWEQLLGQLGMSGALRGQAEREADPGRPRRTIRCCS